MTNKEVTIPHSSMGTPSSASSPRRSSHQADETLAAGKEAMAQEDAAQKVYAEKEERRREEKRRHKEELQRLIQEEAKQLQQQEVEIRVGVDGEIPIDNINLVWQEESEDEDNGDPTNPVASKVLP